MPRFEWDPAKARSNKAKHRISFETATLVWSDPLFLIRMEPQSYSEERWQALGRATDIVLLVVVHTYPDGNGGRVRLISARKATPAERRMYEADDY